MVVAFLSCSGSKHAIAPTIKEPSSKITFFDVDAIHNTFTLDDHNRVVKLNAEGSIVAEYADVTLGPIGQLDVFNPQKVLIHYDRFAKAIILDQSLTSTRILDLEQMQLWNIQCLGLSADQNIWVFDNASNRLKKVDIQGSTILESESLGFYIKTQFSPERLIQRHNYVYLSMPSWGWLRFDLFGQFYDAIPQPHDWFHVDTNGELVYWYESSLYHWIPGKGVPEIIQKEVFDWQRLIKRLTGQDIKH
jgi:hypothetical protein